MMRKITLAISFGTAILAPFGADAGVRATTRSSNGQADQAVVTKLEVEGRQLRMDVEKPGPGRPPMTMLFNGKTGVLQIVNHQDRSITQLDRDSGKQIRERMEAARREVLEKLKQLPAEQRAMAEKMLAGRTGVAGMSDLDQTPTPGPVSVLETKDADQVGGRKCRIFAVRRDGAERARICAQSWAEAGVNEPDLRALEDLGAFQTRMVEEVGGGTIPAMHHPFDLFRQVDGIPLRTRQNESDGSVRETVFTSVVRADIPLDRFVPPEGYAVRPLLPPMR